MTGQHALDKLHALYDKTEDEEVKKKIIEMADLIKDNMAMSGYSRVTA